MDKKYIYLDHAATTATKKEVVDAMLPFFTESYGNPSSIYSFSNNNKKALAESRKIIADSINTDVANIYFTAGGSESDNWVLKETARAYASKGKHIITSKIEHHAIMHTCDFLEKEGYEITYLDVDKNGIVDLEQLKASIRPDTILIAVMFANNEIGTIEPIKEIGAIAKENGVLFFTDAVQAYAHVPIDVEEMNIDMLAASGHKFGGPKGIGFCYIRKGIKIRNLIHGGAQERARRAGTENVPGIVGIAKAAELAIADMEKNEEYVRTLRDHMLDRILNEIPYTYLNGGRDNRVPNNINIAFKFIESETILLDLDVKGICASSGSACASASLDPSHVLLAIGVSHELANGSVRFSLGEDNTMEEIDEVCDYLRDVIERRRAMSPLYEDFIKKNS